MNAEDRFAAADPARGLTPLSAEAREQLARAAEAGEVSFELPTPREPPPELSTPCGPRRMKAIMSAYSAGEN